ncbi:ABC transporter family substrate-binding protein [Amycolatopsis sp. QT-25]|uniref:ABC transporter family substrate-binding protein n=1 Tax=Amycolatopsis sp. QT-25 TaxID=3034022 RepID=UPI0023ECC426|nr:ABC transporter family substrate-binding protein [Amycolatopsis sp. QT-25]WET83349.1 ABC transporter family substrate-binding protein [Amycolatopsis sp. QT-25]
MLACAAVLLAACSNTPPPPVVSSSASPVSTSTTKAPSQVVVGVDDVLGGYNPHNLADASQVTSALSQLLLPSVFRAKDDGSFQLDKNLMKAAEVVSQQPFTVAYTIRPDASWSDSAPIAAEDFAYLHEAMRDQPGVIGAAGYRLISDIQSREGGKRVEVTFAKPYPGWQTLFANLLPAHLLKDAPNGWRGALATTFPAVAGPYSIKGLDTARGEITLERNERYWEKPSALDRIVLRAADQDGTLAALRSGNDQFAMTRTDGTGLKRLGELGSAVQLHTVARPTVAQLLLRPVSSTLSDSKVREGLTALIDRGKLITEATEGGPSGKLRADAQVRVPSAPGFRPTIPAPGPPSTADPAKGEELLKAAGYTKEAGTWRKNGKNLSLVVASPAKQEPYATIAKELTAQLVAAGIEVNAIAPQPRELFSTLLAMPVLDGIQQTTPEGAGNVGIDIAVIGQVTGGADVASALASTFGCRPDQLTDKTKAVVPGNPLGFCDPALQPSIDAALTGATPVADTLSTLEPELWRRNVVIPLFQLADTLAIGSGISGVTAGPPMVGPFGSAVNWTRGPK